MKSTIHVASGHTLFIEPIEVAAIPVRVLTHKESFTKFYVVRNGDKNGVVFFYLGKGHKDAPAQICVWYPNGRLWSSYGTNFKDAIEGAQRDGWLYAHE